MHRTGFYAYKQTWFNRSEMAVTETCVPVAIARFAVIWVDVAFLFLFVTRDTYRSSWGIISLLRPPAWFCIAFSPSVDFLIVKWHILTLPLQWSQWWQFDLLPAFQLLFHDHKSTQIMSCKHFAVNYCNTTLNFIEISSTTCGAILVRHLTAWNSEWMMSFWLFPFIQITNPALPRPLHFILLLLVTCWECYFV